MSESDSQEASAYVVKLLEHAHSISTLTLTKPTIPAIEMQLVVSDYYVKVITKNVFDRGFGLFTASQDSADIQNGLSHMIRCLNRIYYSPARDAAEYPIAVRTPDEDGNPHYELIFADLTKQGFTVGVPNRLHHEKLYAVFLAELERVVNLAHEAGVIHVDLYTSNIM